MNIEEERKVLNDVCQELINEKWISNIIEHYVYQIIEQKNENNTLIYQTKFGEKHGEFKKITNDNKLIGKGYYRHEKEEGEFTYWYTNGNNKVTVIYKNGKEEGELKQWFENGQLEMICHYKNGLEEGEHKQWYNNGQLQLLSYYKNGLEDGESKQWFENRVGDAVRSQRDLTNERLEPRDPVSQSPEGDNSQIQFQIQFKEGKMNGSYKQWHNNNQMYIESHYINGKKTGEGKQWFQNGQLQGLLFYLDDKLHGEFKEWNEEGILLHHQIYEDGELIENII